MVGSLLPTVLRDWWGFFVQGSSVANPTAMVVIDYQNIHLTGRDLFAPPGVGALQCLVHPLLFAEQVLITRHQRLARKAMLNPGSQPAEQLDLVAVIVHRGQPSNAKNPTLYRYSSAQRSEWTRDRRVEVHYRTLKYRQEYGREIAQEKGIDVRVALSLVRAATTHRADVVILASHDTDLEPAIEDAIDYGSTRVETAGWERARVLRPRSGIRHTTLDGAAFVRSRDRRPYDAGV